MPLALLTCTTPLWAGSGQTSGAGQKTGSGSYSAESVTRLVEDILSDADAAVAQAYAEGYKAATVELLPELEALRAVNVRLREDSEEMGSARGKGCGLPD